MNTAVCNSNVGVIWLDVENWHFNDVCVLETRCFLYMIPKQEET